MAEQKHNSNVGPMYGVELIDSLPFDSGPMRQAMPSRDDLMQVFGINGRVVAGYEVLLAHYQRLSNALAGLNPSAIGQVIQTITAFLTRHGEYAIENNLTKCTCADCVEFRAVLAEIRREGE